MQQYSSTQRGLARPDVLRVRINTEERETFKQAASLAGLSLSSWTRMVLREYATARLKAAGKEGGFL